MLRTLHDISRSCECKLLASDVFVNQFFRFSCMSRCSPTSIGFLSSSQCRHCSVKNTKVCVVSQSHSSRKDRHAKTVSCQCHAQSLLPLCFLQFSLPLCALLLGLQQPGLPGCQAAQFAGAGVVAITAKGVAKHLSLPGWNVQHRVQPEVPRSLSICKPIWPPAVASTRSQDSPASA